MEEINKSQIDINTYMIYEKQINKKEEKQMSFFKKVKEIEVTIFDKAKMAVLGVESALSIFANLIGELNHANENLKSVVDEADKVIQEHQDLKDKAQSSIQEYETLIQNIEKIIGGTK